MENLRILIVEDEIIHSEPLKYCLEKSGYHVVGVATNAHEAKSMLDEKKPDLAILDLQMQGSMQGIEVAEYINSTSEIPFIFLTANEDIQVMLKLRHTQPRGYLTKPFRLTDIIATVDLSIHNHKNAIIADPNEDFEEDIIQKDFILIKQNKSIKKVELEEVFYFKAAMNYSECFTINGRYVFRKSIQQVEQALKKETFVRTHRSYIINITKIEYMTFENIILKNKAEVPCGRKYHETTKQAWLKYKKD